MQHARWEFKRLIIGAYTTPIEREDSGASFFYYGKAEMMEWKDAEVSQLGREGWELVSAVPIEGGRVKEDGSVQWGTSYTISLCLWFKRQLP